MGQKKKGNKKTNKATNQGSEMTANTSRLVATTNDRKLREEAEKEAQQAMQVAFINLMNEEKVPYITNDGDQSIVTGDDAIKLKWKWASGLDWNPGNTLLSNWLRVLAVGDYEGMMLEIEKVSGDDLKTLLERRETLYQFSALFHVIKGASTTLDEDGLSYNSKCLFVDRSKQPQHLKCAVKLIELGANVNARDILGATPLFFCVMRYRNKATLKIAKILLDNGADVNTLNRLGETALLQPALMKRYDCVKFLCQHGSDPAIRDHEGGSVQDLTVMDKELKAILCSAKESDATTSNIQSCVLCGQPSKSRCTACFLVRYCSKECQLVHWDKHKKPCKETKKKFSPVNLSDEQDERIPKDNFVGRLQITKLEDEGERIILEHPEKGFLGFIQPTHPLYREAKEKIRDNEMDCGYAQVVVDKDLNIKLNLTEIYRTI